MELYESLIRFPVVVTAVPFLLLMVLMLLSLLSLLTGFLGDLHPVLEKTEVGSGDVSNLALAALLNKLGGDPGLADKLKGMIGTQGDKAD